MLSKEKAATTIRRIRECSGQLDQSVAMLQGAVEDDLFVRYRSLVGQTLAEFYDGILSDLFAAHPDLEPDSFKAKNT